MMTQRRRQLPWNKPLIRIGENKAFLPHSFVKHLKQTEVREREKKITELKIAQRCVGGIKKKMTVL